MITINTPGAKTLATATAWKIDGQGVYVLFSGETAELHIRGRKVADRPAAEIIGANDAQDWAVEYLAAEAEQADEIAAEFEAAITAEAAPVAEGKYDLAVSQMQARGAEMIAEAVRLEAFGTGTHRRPRKVNGEQRGWVKVGVNDPSHPARKAETLRRDAALLATWTGEAEAAYSRYVDNGISGTDGWYAPLSREAWAAKYL